jgi:hypothetical protein
MAQSKNDPTVEPTNEVLDSPAGYRAYLTLALGGFAVLAAILGLYVYYFV